jgi:outer membrane protein OmpA-like peptidoglycan-associated protein/tetratricopeptide (TPR) repeat protein
MKKIAVILILIVSSSLFVAGQRSESDIALREYFIDAEFFLTQEFYMDALSDYLQVYKRGYEDNANINCRIGICYLKITGQKDKSIAYLEKAAQSASIKYKESSLNEKNAPIDVYLYLGNAYRVNNRLQDAINAYNKYKELLPADEKNLHQYADKQIEACNIANEFMSKPVDLTFVNLGEDINSSSDDYNPVVSGDGNSMVYMHKLPFYEAVYYSKKINGVWGKPENITPQIMSDGNQYVSDISYDGKTILLSVEDEFNCDIFISQYIDNRWTKSQRLGPTINTKYWESHASFSRDGSSLYFTSNRNGGAGDMDIYVAKKTATGDYGPAKNIKEINTGLNEDTPFVTADGSKLYFSSQGYVNMGGYDIFVSALNSDGTWSLPENVGYPISTTDDDLFYFPWNNGEKGFIAKIFDEGMGTLDIYKVLYGPETQESFAEVIPTEKEAAVETESTAEKEITDTTAKILPEVEQPVTTMVKESSEKQTTETRQEEVKVEPETTAVKTVEISPVFFEFDRSQLSDIGRQELDKLVTLLKTYSGLKVKLSGFADALGPDPYNKALSEKRAISALNYLVSNGIEPSRLKAEGLGETNYIARNTHPDGSDNPEGRRFNRRVEFEIVGANAKVLIIKRIDPVPNELKLP